MDVQDFLIQGEGHEEDKREAWQLFQQAYERQMKGELEEAVTLYKKSIESHPTAEAYTFLGWTYSFMGRLDDAIELCHRAIRERDAHILWAVRGVWDGWDRLYEHPKWKEIRKGIFAWRPARPHAHLSTAQAGA